MTSAFQFADDLWRALPPLKPGEAERLTKIFETGFGSPLPTSLEVLDSNLRRPHCAACFTGIFGGGPFGIPGDYDLASYGVLLFCQIEEFKPDILVELAGRMRLSPGEGAPLILLHSLHAADLPSALFSPSLPALRLN